ncbi:MAG: endolytic transglycosylase MltG [Bradyrhizobiaceae bacterium]|nr:endolytic transglycosylase MltG [Bradyrhizobiaceae bacterium]
MVHPRSPRQAIAPERMPPPPSRRARHPLVIIGNAILTGIVLLIIAAGAALYVGKEMFEAPGPLDRERTVVIPRASGIRDIAELLRRERIIDRPFVFVLGAMASQATGNLKAGEYLFDANVSMREVLDTLVEGRSIQHQVTIPEGLTSEQIVQRLMESDVLTGEIGEIPQEGTLLPETYKVVRGTTRQQLIARMTAAHRRLVQETWERRAPDLPVKTVQEFITLASIVEKETGKADERTRVASVFINRLNRRMRLQSDPTIIYGLAGGKGSLGRPLTRDDVERPTPYNTYAIDGLPPGPIANPGRASLEAVANPSRTKELYFVADGSGGHVFAATYDDHLKNVARWRQYQKEQATIPPPSETGNGNTPAPAATPPAGAQKAATGGNAPPKPPLPPEKGAKRTGQTEKSSRTQ